MTLCAVWRASATLLVLAGLTSAQLPETRVFQTGVAGGAAARTHACVIANTGGDGTVTEADTLTLGSGRGLIVFPHIIGSGTDQVVPGASVSSATLEVYVDSVPGAAATRSLLLLPLFDLTGEGPWHEPAQHVTAGANVGTSWLSRDARPGIGVPWLVSGGDVAVVPAPWAATATVTQASGVWYSLDVTAVVGLMAAGWTNHGWSLDVDQLGDDLVIASDDHPDPTKRPKLTVQWSSVTPGFNHVPTVADITLSTTEGAPVTIPLPGRDPDSDSISYVIRERPQNGTLEGDVWWVYKPDPGFIGTDTWTFYAHDGFASSPITTVTVNVTADPAATSSSLSSGGPGTAAETRSATLDVTADPAAQSTEVGPELTVAQGMKASVIDLPFLTTGTGAIPAGATIVAAQLRLTVSQATGQGTRTVSAHRLVDPGGLGGWHQPQTPGTALDSGVSWLYRDARTASLVPWLVPGGERAVGGSTSASVDPVVGTEVAFEVTAAVSAWVSGEPNVGWILESDLPDATSFASESHANAAWRPKLTIVWRAAGAGGSDLPPVADAGPDRSVIANQVVALDGSASYDPEGQPLLSLWYQVGGPAYAIPTPFNMSWTLQAPASPSPRTYTFILAVWDGGVGYDFDTVSIAVQPLTGTANGPPVADAGADATAPEGTLHVLDGSQSYDPEGTPLSATWEQVSGPPVLDFNSPTSLSATVWLPFTTPALSPEPLGFRLAVTDGVHTTYDWVIVSITDHPNQPPTANAGPSQSVEADHWVGLDGRASFDPDSPTLTYTWTQTQGPAVTLAGHDTAVPYFKAPTISAQTDVVLELQVSDFEFTSTSTTTVTVLPSPTEFTGNPQSLTPYTNTLSPREARHLLQRAAYSGPPALAAQVVAQGLNATIAGMMSPIPAPAVDSEAWARVPTPLPGDTYPQANSEQVAEWWLTYKLRSPWQNQLKEKISYFYHDQYAAGGKVADDRERHWQMEYVALFRNTPWPNYRQFLIDLTRNNLMLDWLDNHRNRAVSPNENYAREFWELFTLGPFDPSTGLPNYTETDIQEASRAFTGWERYDPVQNPSDSYYSRFNQARHDSGTKNVLGFVGPWKDEDVVDITLTFPRAAEFICENLFRYFVHDQATPATVQALAQVLTSNGWELAPVIETILKSEAMFSTLAVQPRVKTPTEYVINFMRETGLESDIDDVHGQLQSLGHVVVSPPNVKGWPEGSFWLTEASIAYRSQAINAIIEDRVFQHGLSLDHLMPPQGLRSGAATVAHLLELLNIELDQDDQFHTLVEYMDNVWDGQNASGLLFDGDDALHVDQKLRGVLFLLAFATPDYHTN